eukprot:3288074-Amphidinium_carterae.1
MQVVERLYAGAGTAWTDVSDTVTKNILFKEDASFDGACDALLGRGKVQGRYDLLPAFLEHSRNESLSKERR